MVNNIEEREFGTEVLQSSVPVIAYFQNEWCSACKGMSPLVDRVAAESGPMLKWVRIDTLKAQKISVDHMVLSTPTLILFKSGSEADRAAGFLSERNLKSFAEKAIL